MPATATIDLSAIPEAQRDAVAAVLRERDALPEVDECVVPERQPPIKAMPFVGPLTGHDILGLPVLVFQRLEQGESGDPGKLFNAGIHEITAEQLFDTRQSVRSL